ncbi:MAG TPA: cyclic nucleotide-binding domain-containing protein [Nocardioides sp.]|uniref:cyclic nucleotide-binding domain-containing protein n=1 Tax=Nocardioides sp. TaxID=35761 RepID=UPI002E36968F|nr:cyclic nucleotide-binding domain-containing protein [Nocardioides sp.]HEX3929559.1 cyclic nucleotide-binding domain-containing protein [Nocardioides sp.]
MLLTIERVTLLKRVSLFERTPDRVLAGLARTLLEEEFPVGTDLMVAGAVEDWMFVLTEGTVRVTRPDRAVDLGAGQVVGELAVLEPEPRTATVTALTDVRAFRLRKVDFDEALRTRPEIAVGVIAELVRRLREAHSSA